MRRRVMSHNAKRMPRRLREAHLNQMIKSGLPPKTKRSSRKYRRRPQNLLQEYNRRQRKNVWLETHIWHAKRFHMTDKWGYKIANYPNDKSFRACYRAVAKHCLLQDISYYNCLEISGPGAILKEILKRHCNPKELTFGAKIYWQGSREGKLMFFKKDRYPKDPVGIVRFLWRSGDSEYKTIWIWVHPVIYKTFLKEIVTSFTFNESTKEKSLFTNDQDCNMRNLSHSLNRFRLTGPLSIAILTDALHLPRLNSTSSHEVKKSNTSSEMDVDVPESEWHDAYYKSLNNSKAFKVQRDFMEELRTLKSPNQLPPNSVMGVTVLDPRFFLPVKRTKKVANGEYYVKIPMPAALAHHSLIWDPDVRRGVKAELKSTQDINAMRSECLVPGVGNDDKFDEGVMSKIPVMLIQNPGCESGAKSIGKNDESLLIMTVYEDLKCLRMYTCTYIPNQKIRISVFRDVKKLGRKSSILKISRIFILRNNIAKKWFHTLVKQSRPFNYDHLFANSFPIQNFKGF